MIKKVLIVFLVLSFILVNGYMTISYAASVKVTDENLKSTLQEFVSSKDNNKNYKIIVENNQIKIKSDDGNYNINYDLTNKPTFMYEADIAQGMSYEDFQEKTQGSSSTIIAYSTVAKIQGVEYEDALLYFTMYLLASAFSSTSSVDMSNSFVIVNDTDVSEGVTIEKDSSDTKTIYASEFGNHVMEYVNSLYTEKQILKDTDGLNTFEITTERKDVTDTSCKIVTTLTVDTSADFSKMIGYANQLAESMMDKNITEENADYVIKLKVGQKCKIESNESVERYEILGSSCIEFDENRTNITATEVGKANGYIYVGNNNTKKSIYVIVEENVGNKALDSISIKLDETGEETPVETPVKTPEETPAEASTEIPTEKTNNDKQTTIEGDNTIKEGILPQTGSTDIIIVSTIALLGMLCLTFWIEWEKYKEIN